jgi:predicted NBD/HSP70 family sugar kinase
MGSGLGRTEWTILNTVRRRSAITRWELVSELGLSWGSISNGISELKKRNFVTECQATRSGEPAGRQTPGRDAMSIRVNHDAGYFLGLLIDAPTIKACLIDFGFSHKSLKVSQDTHGTDLDSLFEKVNLVITECLDQIELEKLMGVGIAWPGTLNFARGVARSAPNIEVGDSRNPHDLNISINDILSDELMNKLKDKSISFDNDLKCLIRAERELGGVNRHWRKDKNMVAVYIGRGVGIGMISDGQVHRGESNYSGELGHCIVNEKSKVRCGCGLKGCLEQEVSELAVLRKWYSVNSEHIGQSVEDIICAANNQNRDAIDIFAKFGEYLGKGLGSAVNILNPRTLVISGTSIISAYNLFVQALETTLNNVSLRYAMEDLIIERSNLGVNAIPLGAAISAYALMGERECKNKECRSTL